MLLFSAVLQLGLLLPMAQTFHRVSVVGIGLNALAIPLMTLLLALALPTVVLGAAAPALAAWPAKILGVLMSGLFALTELPGLPAWLSYRVPDSPRWVAWGFAVSAVIAAWALARRTRLFWTAVAALVIFALLISLHPFQPRLPGGALEVTALDCGSGDALFLVLPDRSTMLVDAGGSPGRSTSEGTFQGRRWDPGENIVSPYLWSRGIRKIDIVALSHAHEDHLGGLFAVVKNFHIGEFWNGTNPPTPAYQALLEQIRRRGILVRELSQGDLIERGTISLRVLWPPPGPSSLLIPPNDASLVLRISNGQSSVLLPGDISAAVERKLVRSGTLSESEVLKVAHHGSKSSSSLEFLARVRPRVALLSSDGATLSNLPNADTLARLRAAGARVLRTDLDGAVTVKLKGSALSVQSYRASPTE
jgi:competence protein ComEC